MHGIQGIAAGIIGQEIALGMAQAQAQAKPGLAMLQGGDKVFARDSADLQFAFRAGRSCNCASPAPRARASRDSLPAQRAEDHPSKVPANGRQPAATAAHRHAT